MCTVTVLERFSPTERKSSPPCWFIFCKSHLAGGKSYNYILHLVKTPVSSFLLNQKYTCIMCLFLFGSDCRLLKFLQLTLSAPARVQSLKNNRVRTLKH